MKILEVRDGFIKLETRATITTGSFIEAKEEDKSFIAQIVRTLPSGEYTILVAKILFVYDGIFNPYNGEVPKESLSISLFPFDEINKIFETPTSIDFIQDYQSKSSIKIDKNVFNKKFLASLDNIENIKNISSVLRCEFSKQGNCITIDTLNVPDENTKYVAGEDFKLPLNTAALAFLYEECLNDATADSKTMIKEIFQDLSEYSKTVSFLPFSTLKTIIDDMVEKQHIFKLLVLKNKLAKFDKLGYFATDANEVEQLTQILKSKNPIIDLSKLDSAFQNRYLEAIYFAFEKLEEKPQVTLLASNSLTKKTLKTVLTSNHSATALIVNSRFKYLKDIKPMFTNYLIETSFVNNDLFKNYTNILTTMPKDACLFVGNSTNNLALITSIEPRETTCVDEIEEIISNNEESIQETLQVEIEKDEDTLAIEKKSDDLIEKISEEVETAEPTIIENLFGDDEETEIIANDEVAEDTNDNIDNEIATTTGEDDELLFKEETADYSTQVHPEIIIEDDEIEETPLEPENDYETVIEEPIIEEITSTESVVEEIETEDAEVLEENIVEVEMPAEVADLDNVIIEDSSLSENILEQTDTPYDEAINEYEDATTELVITEEAQEETISKYETLELTNDSDTLDGEDDEIFEEILNPDDSELDSDSDIIVVDVDNEIISEIDDEVDKEIVEDVDKVFTTMKEEEISDSDLDFIDELNDDTNKNEIQEYTTEGSLEELSEDFSDTLNEAEADFIEPLEEFTGKEELTENEILETRTASTPMVPVYDADIPKEDTVLSDPIEQGDSVIHAKYGNGVVEKMINYGTKTLYSINFENVGRRLLDPTITEIKKA